jgi:hypothetical protein
MAKEDPMLRLVRCVPADVFGAAADAMVDGRARPFDWAALTVFCERYGIDVAAETLARRSAPAGPGESWWRCNLSLLIPRPLAETVELCAELAVLEATGRGPRLDSLRHAQELSGALYQLQSYQARLGADDVTRAERSSAIMIVRCSHVARCMRS